MSTRQIESQQLGTIQVQEADLFQFPSGLPGFPDAKEFCLVQVKAGSRFQLLQCTSRADLAFVVTDPVQIDPNYPIDIIRRASTSIGLLEDEPIGVAAIVTVPSPPSRPTANMLAPLAIGSKSRVGVQIILNDAPYQVRHPL